MNSAADTKILKEIQDRLQKAIDEDDENRKLALDDLEFVGEDGAQWPEEIKNQRISDGRPCLTINKMSVFIDQVVGDQRMNRPSIKVVPVDSVGDPEVARILGGWIKHVQQVSKADIAIDHGVEHAVTCGYGALRVVTKYVNDTSQDQDAFIEKVDNALAIYWGKALEYDRSDANYCILITDMDRDEYKEKYGEEGIEFNTSSGEYVEGWCTKDTVRLAEYFVKEFKEEWVYFLEDGRAVKELEEEDVEVGRRKVKSYSIMWYLVSGSKVLEKKKWVGKKYIPIIPIWGKELNIAGKRKIRGLIRHAKDSQRMFNYWNALSLNTLIPTPEGWLKMRDIKSGYQVFDEKGQVCNVTNISPVYKNRECLEVLFDDGSVITADKDHLWKVEERGKRVSAGQTWETKVIATKELVSKKHFIYLTEPLDLPEQKLLIHPYVLGVWLGDGSSREPNFTQHIDDMEEISSYIRYFGYELGDYIARQETSAVRTILGVRHLFTELNLLENKHIPYQYVRGSKEQRLELLRGLMDTDGSINPSNGSCYFTTTSIELAKGFSELLHTLGIKTKHFIRDRRGESNTLANGQVITCRQLSHEFYFTVYEDMKVFHLKRKFKYLGMRKEQRRRTKRFGIKSITSIPSVDVKCITVDSESSLYLAGNSMIPTHNSIDTEVISLQPRNPYLVTPKQISGHESQWKEAHKKNFPYLLVNPDPQAPAWPKRETPPQASSGMIERIQATDQEMRDTVGLQKAALGMQGNERSGKAIIERKKEGDVGTFAFIDNLARSIEQLGRVLVDVAPGVLDTERIVRLGLENGSQEFVDVNKESEEFGTKKILNDTSVGTYDVVVSVGPSFDTQRSEARQSMSEFIQYYPDAAPLIGDLYAKVMDWPGAEEVSERLEFLLPKEIKETKAIEDAKLSGEPPPSPPPPPPPTPEQQMEMQSNELKLQEGQIKLQESQVKLQDSQLELEESKMKFEQEKVKLEQEKVKLIQMQQDVKMKAVDFIGGRNKRKEEKNGEENG